ncbi:MAG: hypothetical protein LBJ88_07170 [Campylobacteraceae bacterium]|jgi:hypothetical protein|nr:hypothetical protein [Campylobacteraceae bacterium]
MQIRAQKLGKLFFLALVFSFLVGCGGSDSSSEKDGGFTEHVFNEKISTTLLDLDNATESGFPVAPSHIFGPIWELASVVTHTVEYSELGYDDQVNYASKVKEKFPDILQILGLRSGIYHNVAYYHGNLIGDASVKITDNGAGAYSVEQAVDLIVPLPFFAINSTIFTGDEVFPKLRNFPALEGGQFPITKVSTTIHYGYFGSPNFQKYKDVLTAAGFESSNGKLSGNIWVKEVPKKVGEEEFTLVYTFKHDNPLLNAAIIPVISDFKLPLLGGGTITLPIIGNITLPSIGGGTVAGFVNHYITNWTNIDKYASWTVSVKE